MLYKSAIFRYLHRNLLITQIFKGGPKRVREIKYEANTAVILNESIINEIRNTTSFLFNCIKEENKGKLVIIVFDAPRESIYNGKLAKSKLIWMHEMVKELSEKNNFNLIDLRQFMEADYKINKKKFNSEIDDHWNEYGHSFVAKILERFIISIKNYGSW